MSYIHQVYYDQVIDNLSVVSALGNLKGGKFTSGTSVGWTSGSANESSIIFTSTTASTNVVSLSTNNTSAAIIVTTNGGAAITESAVVTIRDLAPGQSLRIGGLTFTVGPLDATAAQIAAAFSGLLVYETAAEINARKNLSDTTGGIFTDGRAGGLASGWSTGPVIPTSKLLFTAAVANTNLDNLAADVELGTSAPLFSINQGVTGTSTESVAVSFTPLAARQSLSMGGLTFTAGASGANALQVATAFEGVNAGSNFISINRAKNLNDAAGGTFVAGTAAGWNSSTGDTTITFTSVTALTNVEDFTINLDVTGSAPLLAITDGSSATTESAQVEFSRMAAGERITLAGATFTAGVYGATSEQVASAFSNFAVQKSANMLNVGTLTMASDFVVTPGLQTNATSLAGYFTSPVNNTTYAFLAAGNFATTTTSSSSSSSSSAIKTIASVAGTITKFELFLNGALVDSISYGAGVDTKNFGVTVSSTISEAILNTQKAQAASQHNVIKALIDKGATFIASDASNGGEDQVRGGAGNDLFNGFAGNDYFDGMGGVNTAVYRGVHASYNINKSVSVIDRADPAGLNSVSAIRVTDTVSARDGVDTLLNVNRLKFSDITIALDVQAGENAGMAYRMYKAALNRAPDLGGLGDWIGVLDNGGNIFTDLARGFTESAEFKARYGPDLSNEAFVTLLYNNVLARDPDQGGLNAWVGAIEQRGATREVVLHGFSESPENIRYSLSLIGQGAQYIE